jgi:hypothetical protein
LPTYNGLKMLMKTYIRIIVLSLIFGSLYLTSSAQNIVTAQNGAWNVSSTWVGGIIPTAANSATITINHNVTIPNGFSVTIDGTTINSGRTLTVNTGGTLNIANVANALTVTGTLIAQNSGVITGTTGSNVTFNSGSTYSHRFTQTEGVIPKAVWNTNATLRIEGYTTFSSTTAAGNWNQSFGNVVFNLSGLRSGVLLDLAGRMTSIAGSLTLTSTGSGSVLLTNSQTAAINIDGSVNISGVSRLRLTNTGTVTLNVAGDFTQTAGVTTMALGTNGVGILNLEGDFSLTGGSLSETGAGTAAGTIRFIGDNLHQFVNTGSITNVINWYVGPNDTVDLDIYPFKSTSASTFTLDGGTIIVRSTSPLGAIQNSATAGNIQTATLAGNRIYNPGSTVIYRSTNPQFMGNGQPSEASVTTIIDNTADVSLASTVTINGVLNLDNGQLQLASQTLNLNGTVTYNNGTFGATNASTLVISGTTGGSVGTLRFGSPNNTLGTLTLNRTGGGVSASVNSSLIIGTQLNLNNGQLNNISGLTMANAATIFRYPSGTIVGTRPTVANGESYNVTFRTFSSGLNGIRFSTGLELPLPTDVNALNNVNILLQITRDTLDLQQDIYVNGTFDINRGQLFGNNNTITMEGPTWFDDGGTFNEGASGLVIFVGTTTVTGSSNPNFTNIQANAGTNLTFTRSINISGNIDFQSGCNVIATGITLTINGSGLQTIAGNNAAFHNITITKSGGNIQLTTSPLAVVGLLRFNSPSNNVNLMSNGFLTLLSTSDTVGSAVSPGTAQIYRMINNNQVSGNVVVQRYMSGEGRIYRYLSSPVTNATVASWKDDFPITGNFSDPSSGTVCGLQLNRHVASLFQYNEPDAGAQDVGWRAYPSSGTAASNPLEVGRGYAAFIRECTDPTVIDVSGPINQGTIVYPVTYTNTGNGTEDGYNLVGNPYPCTIDWDLGSWTKTRISPVIAITDNGTGITRYWDGDGDPSTLANGQIAPGQAFWVRATAASPLLRSTENVKGISPNQVGEFYRISSRDVLSISLSDGAVKDVALVKTRDESLTTLDDWDAPKISNPTFDIYTISEDNVKMAINSINSFNCATPLSLGIRNLQPGKYTLSVQSQGAFSDFHYQLFDQYTGTTTSLNEPYNFVVDANERSADEGRLKLTIANSVKVVHGASCGAGSVKLSAESGGTIKWYATPTSREVLGTGSTFTTPVLNKTSTYYISVEGSSCLTDRIPVKAEVTFVEKPLMSVTDNLLSVNYQDVKWLYNNEPIAAETSSKLVAEKSGLYSAIVTVNGCEARSDFQFLTAEGEVVKVFPNPIGSFMNLQLLNSDEKIENAVLINGSGSRIELKQDDLMEAREIQFNTSHISTGFYILEVTVNRSKYYYKIIKK